MNDAKPPKNNMANDEVRNTPMMGGMQRTRNKVQKMNLDENVRQAVMHIVEWAYAEGWCDARNEK